MHPYMERVDAPAAWIVADLIGLGTLIFIIWSAAVWANTPKDSRHWIGLLPTIFAGLVMIAAIAFSG